MHKILTGLMAVGAVMVAGCDDGDFVVNTSNDISVTPQRIVFPRVVSPQFDVQNVEIQHGGTDPLIVRNVYLEGFEGCSRAELGYGEADQLPDEVKMQCPIIIDVMPEFPVTVVDGQFETVNIRFQPIDSTVPDALRLVVESNALDKNEQYVDISFQRAQPQISAENVVSFQANVAATEFLIVSNIGSGPLTVQAPTLSLISEPAINEVTGQPEDEFRVTAITPFPWDIQESRSETLDIEYTPIDGNRDTAELTFMSSDPETPSFVVTLTSAPVFGILNVEPNPVSFAVPTIGGMTEKVIALNNAGVRYVDINEITIEQGNDHYRLGGDGQDSFRIQGGSSRNISVIYQPPGNMSSSATLNIRYDDGNDATPDTVSVAMAPEGAALPPVLGIDPVSITMNDVALGETQEATITLTNTGGAPLSISAIRLSEDGDPTVPTDPEFAIVSGGEAVDLEPGASHVVTISLTRAEDDTLVHVGALVIESNAGTSPDIVQFTSNPPQE